MKLYIMHDVLIPALSAAASVAGSGKVNPVLGMVRLRAVDGVTLSLTTTDTEAQYTTSCAANVVSPGPAVCVDARDLLSRAQALGEGTLHVEVEGRYLVVSRGSSLARLRWLPGEDFPAMDRSPGDVVASFVPGHLVDLCSRIAPWVSPDPERYGINGAHLIVDDGRVTMWSTDGHVMSRASSVCDGRLFAPPYSLIPAAALAHIGKMATATGEPVKVCVTERDISAETATASYAARLVDGEAPAYHTVLEHAERAIARTVTVDREAMLRALAPCLATAKAAGGSAPVALTLRPGRVEMSISTVDHGEAQSEVAAEVEGELRIGISASYLHRALRTFPDREVRLRFGDARSPVLFDVPGDDALVVGMPMRLD